MNKVKNNNEVKISCDGAPLLTFFMGISTFIIIGVGGILFCTIGNLYSLSIGLILITTSVFQLYNGLKTVTFYKDYIELSYLFGKKQIVQYKFCKKLFKTNDGLIHAPVNVIIYKKRKRERKITFVCEDDLLEVICERHFNGFKPKSHHL